MDKIKVFVNVLLSSVTSVTAYAEGHQAKPAAAAPAKKATDVKMVPFEGCGQKGKDGKWAKLEYNCFEREGNEPLPPCKKGWVTVKEAVPESLVSHLQQCVYEL